jgi:phosphoribosyl-AMP cyclohydrolase
MARGDQKFGDRATAIDPLGRLPPTIHLGQYGDHRREGGKGQGMGVTGTPYQGGAAVTNMHDGLEEGTELLLDFGKLAAVAALGGLLPCAVQHVDTGEVILIAYVNELALQQAVATRSAIFWSTSRNEIWEKGKTSGQTFELVEVLVNCEQNSLVYRVRPRRGGICHTADRHGAARNCYYRRLNFDTGQLEHLSP